FRANKDFDTADAIQNLGVGEALVSMLDEKGAPEIVQKTMIRPPASRLGPITPEERSAIIAKSPVKGLYDRTIDRESAFELLQTRFAESAAKAKEAADAKEQARADAQTRRSAPRPTNRQGIGEAFAKSLVRSMASSAGRQLIRGILGSLLK
ncbi:MAG: DUF853 family protein, partial [Alphaproteobacteria bacterium]|nr:DUF853 family protein [Alphaproteobacteria bacterium]